MRTRSIFCRTSERSAPPAQSAMEPDAPHSSLDARNASTRAPDPLMASSTISACTLSPVSCSNWAKDSRYSCIGFTVSLSQIVEEKRRYRKLTNSAPSLDGQGLSSGAARPVCDSEFAGQPGQMLVRCPERRVGDKGGSQQMRIDPPNASAVQLA